MDPVAQYRDKLAQFRLKELKDVSTQLGLAKTGKKQDLTDRIMVLLSNEEESILLRWGKRNCISKEAVMQIIDDTYRKMKIPGGTDMELRNRKDSKHGNIKQNEELDNCFQLDMKIRCVCGSSLITESMIECGDSRCRAWQHIDCVVIPETVEGVQPEIPAEFYCELCRISRADPFLVTLSHPLLPTKLSPSNPASNGTIIVETTEKTFQLTRADRELLQRSEYDLQVWCILLNDKVPFRMQWPQFADLQVNAVGIQTVNRPGSQLLGVNGRDDGPVIMMCCREGINKISLSHTDNRVFSFGIRILRRRTIQQVLKLVPEESVGENYNDALARICRCIGGGTSTAKDAGSDSDLEVVADYVIVNLRCPMSGSRMKIAGRFKPCAHMGCFDLETFVEINQRSRKWQCPICLKNYTLENIIIDPYFNRITSLLRNCGEDVNEIEVKHDGSWRAKNGEECWHLPDGSLLFKAKAEVMLDKETSKHVSHGFSEGHFSLKLGIKKNVNGFFEVNQLGKTTQASSASNVTENFETWNSNQMMNSSTNGRSYLDQKEPSVNQEGGEHCDFSTNNSNAFDSFTINNEKLNNGDDQRTAGSKDIDIIVLSDSEEDDVIFISPEDGGLGSVNNEIPFTEVHQGVSEPFPMLNGSNSPALLGCENEFAFPGDSENGIVTQTNSGSPYVQHDNDVPIAFTSKLVGLS